MTDEEQGQLLCIEDAAKYLNVNPRTLRRYLDQSGIKFLVLNPGATRRNIRIAKSDLDTFIDKNMQYKKPEKRVYNRSANYAKYKRKKKPVRKDKAA